MPSKKKAAVSTLVGEYDVELMTEDELRMYVKALEEEHGRMRKARNLYQRDNRELLQFLDSIHKEAIHNKKVGIQKNIEFQEQMLEQEHKLKSEEELVKVIEIENVNQTEKYTLESYINLITTRIRNNEEECTLLKDISEKDREIKHFEYIHKLILTHSEENCFAEYEEISKNNKHSLQNLFTEYHKNFLETLANFSKNKIENLQAIWGKIPIEGENPFSDEIDKMTSYFKDIYWKNKKTIEELKLNLKDLEDYLYSINLKLRDVNKKNSELSYEEDLPSPRSSLITDPSFSPVKRKRLEELTYENYLLRIKLEMLEKEQLDLKRQFVSAVRKIHKKSDLKAFVLENKLSVLQNTQRRFA